MFVVYKGRVSGGSGKGGCCGSGGTKVRSKAKVSPSYRLFDGTTMSFKPGEKTEVSEQDGNHFLQVKQVYRGRKIKLFEEA